MHFHLVSNQDSESRKMVEQLFGTNMSATALFVELATCAAIIIFAGNRLAMLGDMLAVMTGLGHTRIGATVVASITSLPECIVTVSAVTVVHAPALVVGNVLGSNCFNLVLIIVLDLTLAGGLVLSRVVKSHILNALLGIGLMLIVAVGIIFTGIEFVVTLVLAAAFVVAVKLMISRGGKDIVENDKAAKRTERRMGSTLMHLGILAIVIAVAGVWLTVLGDRLGKHEFPGGFRLGNTFVGFLIIAFTTSLPELSVAIAAAKRGIADLTIGDVFGSNIINISFIVIGQAVVFVQGRPGMFQALPRPGAVLITIAAACIMILVAISGIMLRPRKSLFRLGYYSYAIGAIYLMTMYLVFRLSSGGLD